MFQAYKEFKFRAASLEMIDKLNAIIDGYREQGYVLTVRQLYYQCVVRNYVPNTERSYKMITGLVNDGRLAGLIDWDAIEDRTREFIVRGRWESPEHIVRACAEQFHMDMWENQDTRVFVVVEKEALVSVFNNVCKEMDVPLLAARGYPSVSVLRDFCANTLARIRHQSINILHFGDHDPSGIDMTRDLVDRIQLMSPRIVNVERLALNMDQIEEQGPPPNPAKTTDARFADYQSKFGDDSWELDALEPKYLEELCERSIREHIDEERWLDMEGRIVDAKEKIEKAASFIEALEDDITEGIDDPD